MQEQYTIRVEGHVQGVGFRFHTIRQAQSLGLSGWVKNMSDGSVLIVAEGETDLLEQLVDWCHEGPSRARVHRVSLEKKEPQGLKGFDAVF